ncbi:MAG: DegT/DnrJ/EryC1/StrS family aminotransferase [Dyella sp.]|uniref:DegT/DnrJ/EryC1/StrS family aminotransferase n=1 Tax=Dyella sp. TaxID=1869338 RepID=UPI003F7EDCA9
MRRLREIPPTAGLPLQAADLLPHRDALAATLAAQLGTPPLQLECSGTAALLVALHVLKARAPNRSVVVAPAYTCPLVAIAVHRMGLTLRLCDTRPDHWDLDPQALAQACREDTLAILPTHLAGLVADMDAPLAIARATGAFVIEDAAQALGAREGGQSVGLRGDIGFFSLAAGKGLSIYEGGLLATRYDALRDELRATSAAIVPRATGGELRRSVELLGLAALYRPSLLGLAYGMPLRRALKRGDPVAAVGDDFAPQIPFHRVGRWRRGVGTRAATRLPDFLIANRARALQRVAKLRTLPGITVFDEASGTTGSWPFLLVLMPTAAQADAALAELWTAGLGVSRLFVHALPDYAYLADRVPQASMPRARDFAQRALTISNSAWLDDADFERIHAVLGRASA